MYILQIIIKEKKNHILLPFGTHAQQHNNTQYRRPSLSLTYTLNQQHRQYIPHK